MKNLLLASLLGVLLAGCAEPTVDQLTYAEKVALLETLRQGCEAQGVKRDSEEMKVCLRSEAVRETARREKAVEDRATFGAALGAGLTSYGQSQQRAAASYRRPLNCSSNRFGNTVNTTCY